MRKRRSRKRGASNAITIRSTIRNNSKLFDNAIIKRIRKFRNKINSQAAKARSDEGKKIKKTPGKTKPVKYNHFLKPDKLPCQMERNKIRRDYFAFKASNPPSTNRGSSHNNRFTTKRC